MSSTARAEPEQLADVCVSAAVTRSALFIESSWECSAFQKWVFPQKSEGNQPGVADRDAERRLVTELKTGRTAFTVSLVVWRLIPSCPQVVPFRSHIPGGLQPGKRIVMFGVVDPRPDR